MKYRILLTALVAALLLTACQQPVEPAGNTTPSTQVTEASQTPTQAVTSSTQATQPSTEATVSTEPALQLPQEGTPLSEEELEVFRTLFGCREFYSVGDLEKGNSASFSFGHNWYSILLNSLFETPEQADLNWLFRSGTQPEGLLKATADELQFVEDRLSAQGSQLVSQVNIIVPEKADQVLQALLGLTWADVSDGQRDGWIHNPNTGYYYHPCGDISTVIGLEILCGNVLEDGTVKLYYTVESGRDQIDYPADQIYVAALESNAKYGLPGLRFLSNLPVE